MNTDSAESRRVVERRPIPRPLLRSSLTFDAPVDHLEGGSDPITIEFAIVPDGLENELTELLDAGWERRLLCNFVVYLRIVN